MKQNKKTILIFIICFVYGLVTNVYYRPYIYSNNINDLGLADIGNNLTFIPVVYLFALYFNKSKVLNMWNSFLLIAAIEILSYFLPILGTFDFKDLIGLFIGTLFLHILLIEKKHPKLIYSNEEHRL